MSPKSTPFQEMAPWSSTPLPEPTVWESLVLIPHIYLVLTNSVAWSSKACLKSTQFSPHYHPHSNLTTTMFRPRSYSSLCTVLLPLHVSSAVHSPLRSWRDLLKPYHVTSWLRPHHSFHPFRSQSKSKSWSRLSRVTWLVPPFLLHLRPSLPLLSRAHNGIH